MEVKDGLFQLITNESEKTLSLELVDSIGVATSWTISTNAIALAVEHAIDIVLINRTGMVLWRFWHGNYSTTAPIRRNQALFSATPNAIVY